MKIAKPPKTVNMDINMLATVKNGVILAVWSGGREALDAGDRLPSARRLQGA
jgi:hypothetical protein